MFFGDKLRSQNENSHETLSRSALKTVAKFKSGLVLSNEGEKADLALPSLLAHFFHCVLWDSQIAIASPRADKEMFHIYAPII